MLLVCALFCPSHSFSRPKQSNRMADKNPNPGARQGGTKLFRALNPELYMDPRMMKPVTTVGTVVFAGAAIYLTATTVMENRRIRAEREQDAALKAVDEPAAEAKPEPVKVSQADIDFVKQRRAAARQKAFEGRKYEK